MGGLFPELEEDDEREERLFIDAKIEDADWPKRTDDTRPLRDDPARTPEAK